MQDLNIIVHSDNSANRVIIKVNYKDIYEEFIALVGPDEDGDYVVKFDCIEDPIGTAPIGVEAVILRFIEAVYEVLEVEGRVVTTYTDADTGAAEFLMFVPEEVTNVGEYIAKSQEVTEAWKTYFFDEECQLSSDVVQFMVADMTNLVVLVNLINVDLAGILEDRLANIFS